MRKPTDLIFKLDHQFTLYLQRCGVTRTQLSPTQLCEMQKAFYGGAGQLFFLITQDIAELKEREMPAVLSSFQKQILDFWNLQAEMKAKGEFEVPAGMAVSCSCGWKGVVMELKKNPNPDNPREGFGCCPKCQETKLFY